MSPDVSTATNTTHHSEHLADRAAMLAMRTMIALQPKADLGPAGRAAFDELMEKTPSAEGVTYEAATVLLHVGEDEILLDDARRCADRPSKSGSEVELHISQGMAHVFPANLAILEAARETLDIAGEFLRRNLAR
jgi:acetyl esterase/lipase